MEQERRRFFRIEDRVLVGHRRVAEAALFDACRAVHRGHSDTSDLRAELSAVGRRITERVEKLRDAQPDVAAVLDDLNRRVALIQELAVSEQAEAADEEILRVVEANLSGGGLAFCDPIEYQPDSYIDLSLVLLPHEIRLRAVARVVACRELDQGNYELGVEFHEIRDEDRERLIQHIVRRQSERLRADRAQRGSIAA